MSKYDITVIYITNNNNNNNNNNNIVYLIKRPYKQESFKGAIQIICNIIIPQIICLYKPRKRFKIY